MPLVSVDTPKVLNRRPDDYEPGAMSGPWFLTTSGNWDPLNWFICLCGLDVLVRRVHPTVWRRDPHSMR